MRKVYEYLIQDTEKSMIVHLDSAIRQHKKKLAVVGLPTEATLCNFHLLQIIINLFNKIKV